MRYMTFTLLCTMGVAANAATTDYLVTKDPNGFDVYKITLDTLTKLPGSPFGSSLVKFVWTDGAYIYAVKGVATPAGGPGSYQDAQIVSYAVGDPEKQVAQLEDDSLGDGGCGHCNNTVQLAVTSAQHAFLVTTGEGSTFVYDSVRIYHTKSGGGLTFMCAIAMPLGNPYYQSAVTSIRTDANEIYAYVSYVDPTTAVNKTSIFDISTSACKKVGTVTL